MRYSQRWSRLAALGGLGGLGGLLGLVCLLACESHSTMQNPLVRVSFIGKIPKKIRKILPAAIDLDCHRKIELSTADHKQSFMVNWRVADLKGKRYLTAVDVQPTGGTTGGSASAAVGPLEDKGQGPQAQVTIAWRYQKGCSSGEANKLVTVLARDASCKSGQRKDLLRPVK